MHFRAKQGSSLKLTLFVTRGKKKKNKRVHLTCRKKAFSPIWASMKRSLRQDAEHRGPEVDPVLYRFSSGVCWRLPIPSAINKTVIPPSPKPTHPDSWNSISGVCCCGSRERSSPHAHPPSRVCWESPSAARLRWKAQLLAFQHWEGDTHKNSWASLFQRTFQQETLFAQIQKSICTSRNY